MTFFSIFFLSGQLFFALLILFLTIAFITGAPYVPSNPGAIGAMIRFASIKSGMNIYDLGSGDGRLLFTAAENGANAYGIEINPFLVLWTHVANLFHKNPDRVHVTWGSFWRTDISNADCVFVYLLPWRMKELQKKLSQELKNGTIVISNSFIFPDWHMVRHDKVNHIYVFRI